MTSILFTKPGTGYTLAFQTPGDATASNNFEYFETYQQAVKHLEACGAERIPGEKETGVSVKCERWVSKLTEYNLPR